MRKVIEEDWGTFNALVLQRARRAEADPLPPNNALVSSVVAQALATAVEGSNVVALASATFVPDFPRAASPASTGAGNGNQTSTFNGSRQRMPRGADEGAFPPVAARSPAAPTEPRRHDVAPTLHAGGTPSVGGNPPLPLISDTDRGPFARWSASRRQTKADGHPADWKPPTYFKAAPRPSKIGDLTGLYNRLRSIWHRDNTMVRRWQQHRKAYPDSLRAKPLFGLLCFIIDLFWFAGKIAETTYWVVALLLFGVLFGPLILLRVLFTTTIGVFILLALLVGLAVLASEYQQSKDTDGGPSTVTETHS